MILEDAAHRFATDGEKAAWGGAVAHAGTPGNPHGLTRDDIGAAAKATVDNHIASTANPHATTAAQLGAATVQALAAVPTALDVHKGTAHTPHRTPAAQVGAAPLAHVGAGGVAHAAASAAADGFMTRLQVSDLSGAVQGVQELRQLPWHGVFRWDAANARWQAPGAKALAAIASPIGTGLAEVRFKAALAGPDAYTVAVAPHKYALPIGFSLEKFADRVLVRLWDTQEFKEHDDVDFDITVHPIR